MHSQTASAGSIHKSTTNNITRLLARAGDSAVMRAHNSGRLCQSITRSR